jgi:hypothetical protein
MKKVLSVLACSLAFLSGTANSAVASFSVYPTAWRLENYVSDNVVAWFTPTTCTNGSLTFSTTATAGDRNRFWSTVSMAKVAGKKVSVYYENAAAPASCVIRSFALDSE